MPEIIKKEDGTEVEVFTAEELQTKAEEAAQIERERLEAEHKTEKEELERKLKGFEDKDYNFNQLRNKTAKENEEKDKILEELKKVNDKINNVEQQPIKKAKEDFIALNKIAGDKELSDKFEHFYSLMASSAKTPDEVTAACIGALAAATGGQKQPSLDGLMVGTRFTPLNKSDGAVSQASVEIGNALGVSDEDRKKYGKKR